MKRSLFAGLALVGLAACSHPASAAGLDISNLPSKGVICFAQMPDGTYGTCQLDSSNNLKITGSAGGGGEAAMSSVSSSALAANLVVNNGATTLLSFNVSADSTLSASAWWVMIYNATSAPADGAVTPAKCYAAPAGVTSLNGSFPAPLTFSTGVVIGVSTTGCFTKTASTHAFISGDKR